MRANNTLSSVAISLLGVGVLVLGFASVAEAGRGASSTSIRRVIASGSIEAIQSELERAETLICPSCVRMVQPLIDHDDVAVRRVAAWWLARRGLGSDLFVEMSLRLAQPDSILARNAADVLGELRSYRAIKPLGAGLNNPVFDAEARSAMARALGEIGHLAGMEPLKQVLTTQSATVRASALAAMRQLRGFSDISAATRMLGDKDAGVRIEAIYTAAALRSKSMDATGAMDNAQQLVNLVNSDPSADVRKKAAWALGEMQAPTHVAGPALQSAAEGDENPLVRSLAAAALTRLSH